MADHVHHIEFHGDPHAYEDFMKGVASDESKYQKLKDEPEQLREFVRFYRDSARTDEVYLRPEDIPARSELKKHWPKTSGMASDSSHWAFETAARIALTHQFPHSDRKCRAADS